MTHKNVKLLLVDDHPMLRLGLREAVAQHPHLSVVGEASNGAQALKLARELSPDLVVMDIHLPGINGIETTRQILNAQPTVNILIFSRDAAHLLVQEALQAGAKGYVLKRGDVDELICAIDVVMAGKPYFSAAVSEGIVEDYQKKLTGTGNPAKLELSVRERQLLRLIAEGRRNKEIATTMKLSANSIETYRARLMKKVGHRSIAELVRFAVREGIAAA